MAFKLFSKNKAPSAESTSSPESGYDSLRNVKPNNAIMLGQEQAPKQPKIPDEALPQTDQEFHDHKVKIAEYFTGSNKEPSSEQYQALYHQFNSNIIDANAEKTFLGHVGRPMDNPDGSFNHANFLKTFTTIINYAPAKDAYQRILGKKETSSYDFKDFLEKYPTPKDLERIESDIMADTVVNHKDKYEEVSNALKALNRIAYGKQQDYYESFRALRFDAQSHSNTWNIPETPNQQNILQNQAETAEVIRDPEVYGLTQDANNKFFDFLDRGKALFTKEGRIVQGPDQKHFVNEDRAFIDNNQKVFAIFDGAGGSMGGAVASQKCAEVLTSFTNQYYLGGTSDAVIDHLKIAADEMQEALCRNPESRGCCTTGLMAKVSEDNKRLDYICIGDSQLWLIRNGKMQQISTDQGDAIQRNAITNGLGSWVDNGTWSRAYTQAPNEGTLELQPNDIVFLSSDGIMGDWDSQKPDEAVLSNIAANAPSQSSDEIAYALYNASKKLDDTSVVVLKF